MNDDLVHDPELFDSRSWLVIGRYKPLVAEIEAQPRDRRHELGEGATLPVFVGVMVGKPHSGRTGRRGPTDVYLSLRGAMASHGRWVRTSVETGRHTDHGRAARLEGVKVDQGRPGTRGTDESDP